VATITPLNDAHSKAVYESEAPISNPSFEKKPTFSPDTSTEQLDQILPQLFDRFSVFRSLSEPKSDSS